MRSKKIKYMQRFLLWVKPLIFVGYICLGLMSVASVSLFCRCIAQENEREVLTLRVELERAVEIGQQKEREVEVRQEEFQQEMRLKQRLVERMGEEVAQLKGLNEELRAEADARLKEMKRLKHELQIEFKYVGFGGRLCWCGGACLGG